MTHGKFLTYFVRRKMFQLFFRTESEIRAIVKNVEFLSRKTILDLVRNFRIDFLSPYSTGPKWHYFWL